MGLPTELVSKFVKVTKEESPNKPDTIAYGTIQLTNGELTLQLDGSNTSIPISDSTIDTDKGLKVGNRVMVLIKNHKACIIGNLTSQSITVDGVQFELSKIESLELDNIDIHKTLTAQKVTVGVLSADYVDFKEVTTNRLGAAEGDIATLKSTSITADKIDAKYATIEGVKATNGDIYNLKAIYASAERMTAAEAVINKLGVTYANIDFSNIGKAAMEHLFATSGLIENVVIGDGTITGNLVGVTIKGDLIEGNTIVADKLVIQGEDGLYYKLNTDGVTTETEQTDYNSINGKVILAKSITATKIDVKDLVAFDATIGGFFITDKSLHSGVKESVDNTTRGIYMDSDGQMAVGDESNFIKYYKDQNGVYRLAISAESIIFSSSKKSVDDTIKDVIDNIEVGGRNLYIVKNAVDGFLASDGSGGIFAPGGVTKEKTSDYIPVNAGDDIRFQLWVTTPEDSYVWYGYQFFTEDKSALDSNRPAVHLYDMTGGHYHATYDPIVVPDGAAYIRVSARMFDDGRIKVERGTKPTDWTPAPEDMGTVQDTERAQNTADEAMSTATNAETLVQQLSDSISMLVTDGNGTSLMTQTEDGWTFSTAHIQDIVNKTSEDLASLTDEFDETDHAVSVLQQAVADLGVLSEYVKITTYEGEPCIELGEGDSDFKLIITNTRIMFMEGTGVPAYINNQSLHIKKAVIEEELQQGSFVWKVRANGNMGLVWKGGV